MTTGIDLNLRGHKPLYAIHDPETGKFSRGGLGPTWGKSPKTWGIGPLKNHLQQFTYSVYDLARGGRYSNYGVQPFLAADFGVGLLPDRRFPYYDCDLLTIDPLGLSVTETTSVAQWAWTETVRPKILRETRYIDGIRALCERLGIDFDA